MRNDTTDQTTGRSPSTGVDPGVQPRRPTDVGRQQSPSTGVGAGTRSASTGTAGQMTVSSTLIDAVMDVDAARDNGGLQLQEALVRMHAELEPLIAGPAAAVRDGDDVQRDRNTGYPPADAVADTLT